MLSLRCTAIDIDLLGYCKECAAWLYLLEGSTNPKKITRVIHWGAAKLEIPYFLVFHNKETVTSARRGGQGGTIYDEPAFRAELNQLRIEHARVCKLPPLSNG
jgi:hypothetical protein